MVKNVLWFAVLLAAGQIAYAAESADRQDPGMGHGMRHHAAMDGMPGMGEMGKPGTWTTYPLLKIRVSGAGRENAVSTAVPQNIVTGKIDAYSNNLQDENGYRQLAMEMAGATLDKPASGGFHWLSAREERADKVLVASTVYSFGERGAKDPTAMFMQQRQELEIIPQPFPREHSRYRANEHWKFLVRFNGYPLPGQKVILETQNGSRLELLTNEQGQLDVTFPDDFKATEQPGDNSEHRMGMMQGMQGSEFVLATEYIGAGKSYLTAFNGSYGKNAYDKRSILMGLGFTLLGMAGAIPLLRQRSKASKDANSAARNEEV